MNISQIFIERPIMTVLVCLSIILFGVVAFRALPVAALPSVDYPTIAVSAALPGASPETMASTVATPLEREFSTIAGISQMSSVNSLGSSQITVQFTLSRSIDAAAQDVQAAISAAGGLQFEDRYNFRAFKLVVEGNRDSQGAKLSQCLDRCGARLQDGFSQFDLDAAGRQLILFKQTANAIDESRVKELSGRNIDGHACFRPRAMMPLRSRLDCRLQHPVADFHNEAGLFRDGEEIPRRNQSSIGQSPAQ